MKKILKLGTIFFFILCIMLPITNIQAQAAPTSNMLVIDKTKTLNADDKQKIENALYQIYEQTNIEYAVMLIDSLNRDSIENVANEQFRKLGLGDKDKNNGLLILIVMDDHKFRMEVGYGLEGIITDTKAKKIIDCMTDFFKQEDYTNGILASITKTTEILNDSGEYSITQNEEYIVQTDNSLNIAIYIITIIFILILLCIEGFTCIVGGYDSVEGFNGSGGSFGGGSSGGGASGGW